MTAPELHIDPRGKNTADIVNELFRFCQLWGYDGADDAFRAITAVALLTHRISKPLLQRFLQTLDSRLEPLGGEVCEQVVNGHVQLCIRLPEVKADV